MSNSASPSTPLTAWDRVKIARHPERPHSLEYIDKLTSNFVELHGDRRYGEDKAIIGGLARFNDRTVMIIGHQKGGNTRENIERNFGMARPEGYRKAERLMRHAEKFGIPLLTFIDTPGAEPGVGSEERGQGTAIAESSLSMAQLRTPIVACVIGEGGSGGALAIGVADRVLMLENSIYAVASPEACAAILWKDSSKAPEAAETMRITAPDLLGFRLIDEIVPEPVPANEDRARVIEAVGEAMERNLASLLERADDPDGTGLSRLIEERHARFRKMGDWRSADELPQAPEIVATVTTNA